MRPKDRARASDLDAALRKFAQDQYPLPGIAVPANRDAFLEQLVESLRRIEYVGAIQGRPIDPRRAEPSSALFDPIKAAIIAARENDVEEACWLVFLSVHFGQSATAGWQLLRNIYGRLGDEDAWAWQEVRNDVQEFLLWLEAKEADLRSMPGNFGNHRKYESIGVEGTGRTIASYVTWVNPPRSHEEMFESVLHESNDDPFVAFRRAYDSMSEVYRFGRLARFDYLCMLSKLGLAPIEPGTPYMNGATGPLTGARLLFGEEWSARTMDERARQLGEALQVPMQAIEDALCNWQKSPHEFRAFRG